MANNNINKAKGYLNLARSGGYVIFGADNLKGYTHKLYLVIVRSDYGKTIDKVIVKLKQQGIDHIILDTSLFNQLTGMENCKLLAIKNKGLSMQIINNLRGEDGR